MFSILNVCLFVCLFRGKAQVGEEQREGEEEPQAGSMLSTLSPTWVWTHEPWDHDLSRNQKSDAYPTEPRRCPQNFLCFILFFLIYFFSVDLFLEERERQSASRGEAER